MTTISRSEQRRDIPLNAARPSMTWRCERCGAEFDHFTYGGPCPGQEAQGCGGELKRMRRPVADQSQRYLYTDRDGTGRQDPAIRAYGSRFLGRICVRAGAWWRGKAVVRFTDGTLVVVRARLLRKLPEPEAWPKEG
jgi:hypothetical protein